MIHEDREEPAKRPQYPLDSTSYTILDEIGVGVSAVVYKAICIPMNSTVVAIKAIDLDQSRAEFDDIRREAKTLSLLSHPNILNAYCSFTVDHRLWVVMPFMSAGSLQSIISSSFPNGIPEPCIAIILKEILNALAYLHDQGHLHRDIKAGNILMDSNGSVKLADFGVSTSIFEPPQGWTTFYSSSSSLMLKDVAGTPYWMAPEVIHSHNGYSFKADIWSFGITALELAHGRPPLSHLPPSKSLLLKITKRFRFSDYEKHENDKNKKFSKAFKDMVALCLDQYPSKRPSAAKLLKHPFLRYCKGSDFLVKNMLQGLLSVEERFRESKLQRLPSIKSYEAETEENEGDEREREIVKQRRISGWNFNEDVFELVPVFPSTESRDDSGESVAESNLCTSLEQQTGGTDQDQTHASGHSDHQDEIGSIASSGDQTVEIGSGGLVDRESMVGGLMVLKKSLDEQRRKVVNLIGQLSGNWEIVGEVNIEEEMGELIERLKVDLEKERKRNYVLEKELEFYKLQVSGGCSGGGTE